MGIVVVGSLNMDMVVQVRKHPVPGETVLGSDYETHHGGKGANQAVAAARMGAKVRMIGRVGTDEFGKRLRTGLQREGINVHAVVPMAVPTGVAFIAVSEDSQNTIIVSPGANHKLRPENLVASEFDDASAVVMQLEVPLDTVKKAAQLGRAAGAKIILNAAPAQKLSEKFLSLIDVLVVNESEACALAGCTVDAPANAADAAKALQLYCPTVVVTLGEQGAVWVSPDGEGHQPAFEVEEVDSTGAGDAFIGALAAAICEGQDIATAVRWGCAAGSLATSRAGAQPSLPVRQEVMGRLG
ncbi:MAG: ribokinase [Meiothermus sp.]|nr:ribokinase [Meiothermus sp.]